MLLGFWVFGFWVFGFFVKIYRFLNFLSGVKMGFRSRSMACVLGLKMTIVNLAINTGKNLPDSRFPEDKGDKKHNRHI